MHDDDRNTKKSYKYIEVNMVLKWTEIGCLWTFAKILHHLINVYPKCQNETLLTPYHSYVTTTPEYPERLF